MTIRSFLVGIAISTLICFIAWFAVISLSDPTSSGLGGLFIFYFSLFLWLSGFLVLIGFYARTFLAPKKMPFSVLSNSVRQAIIVALAIHITLILKSMQMLNLINIILLAIFVIFAESYYLNSTHEHIGRNRKN
jgi:hypothetical protein